MALSLAISKVDAGMVLIAITLLVAPIAAFAFARSGRAWKNVGGGRFSIPGEPGRRPASPLSPAAERIEREVEVRQMVEAQSYRRESRGEPPLDVDAEVERRLAEPAG